LIDRNYLSGAEEESSQYATLLRAAERERVIPYSGFEQPEHPELESVNLGRSLSKSRSARREKSYCRRGWRSSASDVQATRATVGHALSASTMREEQHDAH
jgi:hypothetical protein